MSNPPRLRGNAPRRSGPYPLGEIPRETALAVGKQLVHRLAIGHTDITGDDFGEIFACAVGGEHRNKPVGVADVVVNESAWSVKTLKGTSPFTMATLRLISGRNSPDFSHGISDPREDVAATGEAVLSIWNARIDESLSEHSELRVVVLVRNMSAQEFVMFEDELTRFIPGNYRWEVNPQNNLVAFERNTNRHAFTWQPHGSQFTIHRTVPAAARKFKIARAVPVIEFDHVLRSAGYQDDWIEFQ